VAPRSAACYPIEDVHLQTTLNTQHRREESDRARAGDDDATRFPVGALTDPLDVFPRLGYDAGRLEQHADLGKRGVDLHGKAVVDAVALGGIAVAGVDPALGVSPVAAHVPLAAGAVRARHVVGATHDADDQIADGHRRLGRGFEHAAKRLVAEDEQISMSVPQTPMARVCTRIGPSTSGGSGMSVNAALPA
jgi:hypothetical protein